MDVVSGGSVIGTFPVPLVVNGSTFFGVVGTAGESIDSFLLRSANVVAGSGGEGFGMDDFALAVIPEPGGCAALLVAAGALLARRRA